MCKAEFIPHTVIALFAAFKRHFGASVESRNRNILPAILQVHAFQCGTVCKRKALYRSNASWKIYGSKILIALKRAGRDPGHGILAAALFPIDGLRNMKLRQGAVLRLTAGDLHRLVFQYLIMQPYTIISL